MCAYFIDIYENYVYVTYENTLNMIGNLPFYNIKYLKNIDSIISNDYFYYKTNCIALLTLNKSICFLHTNQSACYKYISYFDSIKDVKLSTFTEKYVFILVSSGSLTVYEHSNNIIILLVIPNIKEYIYTNEKLYATNSENDLNVYNMSMDTLTVKQTLIKIYSNDDYSSYI